LIDCPGATSTEVKGINNNGQIIGKCYGNDGEEGFIRNPDNTYLTFLLPGQGAPSGINDVGEIVGWTSANNGFLRDTSGAFHFYNVPGHGYTAGADINNLGEIVGEYSGPHGFVGTLRETQFPIMEPPTIALVGLGLIGLGFGRRKRAS
jgi:hypothetical protein